MLGQKIDPTLEFVNELVKSCEQSNMLQDMKQVQIYRLTQAYDEWLRKATTFDSEDSGLLVETKKPCRYATADVRPQQFGINPCRR